MHPKQLIIFDQELKRSTAGFWLILDDAIESAFPRGGDAVTLIRLGTGWDCWASKAAPLAQVASASASFYPSIHPTLYSSTYPTLYPTYLLLLYPLPSTLYPLPTTPQPHLPQPSTSASQPWPGRETLVWTTLPPAPTQHSYTGRL